MILKESNLRDQQNLTFGLVFRPEYYTHSLHLDMYFGKIFKKKTLNLLGTKFRTKKNSNLKKNKTYMLEFRLFLGR